MRPTRRPNVRARLVRGCVSGRTHRSRPTIEPIAQLHQPREGFVRSQPGPREPRNHDRAEPCEPETEQHREVRDRLDGEDHEGDRRVAV